MENQNGRKGRSGSETRARKFIAPVRLDEKEFDEITEKAEASGLSRGGYLRKCALNRVTPGTQRRVPYDRVVLETTIAELRRIGNNLNQIARAANMNEPIESERLIHALDEYLDVLRQLRAARQEG